MFVKLTVRMIVAIGGLSLLASACATEVEDVGTTEDALAKGGEKLNASYLDLYRSEQTAIEDEYVSATRDPEGFDKWAATQGPNQASCWSYPGNVGCWVGDWLVSCEKNANTNDEWDCGVAHKDDL